MTQINPNKEPKIGFVSLGCPKALVDSEDILTKLRTEGYAISPSYEDADLVVVNTCGFIDSAVQESLDAIGEALNENGKVVVTGCLGARTDASGENMVQKLHPKVLGVTGPHASNEVLDLIHFNLPRPHEPFIDLLPPQGIKLTPSHYAYLKISEGCNHRCTFCIIPSLRGDLVSRPIGDVIKEAEKLVQSGVKELLVVSQDTSAYGVDVKFRTGFVNGRPVKTHMQELVGELAQLGAWVRLHYVYPYPHVDNVIELMNQTAVNGHGRVLPYLDVPFQHAHPRVLKAMKRHASSEKVLERIQAWRAACPDLTIRSTFIAGFPSETEEEFQYLLDFLDEAQLDRVGCFAYSSVEGAVANQIEGALPDEVREERTARFMEKQQGISTARLAQKVGSVQTVLIDEVDEDGAIARSMADAPEIDGAVYIDYTETPLKAGEFVDVKIHASDEYDLWGTLV